MHSLGKVRKAVVFAIGMLALPMMAKADEEVSNRIYVRSSLYGVIYAKSIPDNAHGTEGKTIIYWVKPGIDSVFKTFPWYSSSVFLSNTSIVQIGPWNRGRQPNDSDLAIAFHSFEGKTKRYSTKDIGKISHDFSQSVSHYEVFKKVNGMVDVYKKVGKDTHSIFPNQALSITLVGGKTIFMNMDNGELIELDKDMSVQASF